jgi:hypothetical protein
MSSAVKLLDFIRVFGSKEGADVTIPEPDYSAAPGRDPDAAMDGIGGKGIGERSSDPQLVPRYPFD